MRFLITTLQTYESEFYGAVGRELERRGHSVTHVTESRRSARELREPGRRRALRARRRRRARRARVTRRRGAADRAGVPDPPPAGRLPQRLAARRPLRRGRRPPHGRARPRARADLRRDPARRRAARGREQDDPDRRAHDRQRARRAGAVHAPHDLPEPRAGLRRHAARADRAGRGAPRAEPGGARRGRGIPQIVHAGGDAHSRAPPRVGRASAGQGLRRAPAT